MSSERKAPERIWLKVRFNGVAGWVVDDGWQAEEPAEFAKPDAPEYVRADLYEAERAKVERLERENARLLHDSKHGNLTPVSDANEAIREARAEALEEAMQIVAQRAQAANLRSVGDDEQAADQQAAIAQALAECCAAIRAAKGE